MKKKYLVKVFDGKKEKFVMNFLDSKKMKALTNNVKDAHLAETEAEAINIINGIVIADEVADILGKDIVPDDAMYTAVPVYVKA